MIPFGSQRGSGSDLATHVSNAHDNEYVEIAEIRGAIAEDVHGAFAEWEAQAHAMTKAKKYLYSLSINPDQSQGRLSREQYSDYIERTESSLGLLGQPRAVIYHIKEDKVGMFREHCHVVWSRIDTNECKAIHIPFDKEKLMNVTREFALDHGLKLPDGYHTGRAQAEQLSLYDKAQQDQTGITKQERMEVITDLWRSSDSPKAFVAGLEGEGYLLATGRRPYVLVDTEGHMNALPRMIDDKTVRAKDVLGYLSKDYHPEELPSVDEAREMAAKLNQERKQLKVKQEWNEKLEILKQSQEERRTKLQAEIEERQTRQQSRMKALEAQFAQGEANLTQAHAQKELEISFTRASKKPTRFVVFLAKVSGIEYLRGMLHDHQDRQRELLQTQERDILKEQQERERFEKERTHALQMIELRRKETAQSQIFEREKRTLETEKKRQEAIHYRRSHNPTPSPELTLTPGSRRAVPHKAKTRFSAQTAKELNVKAAPKAPDKPIDVSEDFKVAASSELNGSYETGISLEQDFTVKQDRDDGRKR